MARRSSSSSSGSSLASNIRLALSVGRLFVSAANMIMRVVSAFRGRSRAAAPAPAAPLPQAPPRSTIARNAPGAGVVTTRSKSADAPDVEPADAPRAVGTDGGIPDLFRQQRSDVVVTASGRVVKVLPDDLDDGDGSGQHQKFLVELLDRNQTTIKICHNLEFGRVPAREGTIVSFRGEYEFNDKGGTVHWTHHDPKQWHEDGWIEIDGKKYG